MATAQRKSKVQSSNSLRLVEDAERGPIQSQIKKIPSDAFLWLAAGSIVGSLTLKYLRREEDSLFVGQWAPTFAILGVLDKLLRSKSR